MNAGRDSRTYRQFWRARRAEVIDRDGGRCVLCSAPDALTVHHVKPWCLSRDDRPQNLVTLCETCHVRIERPAQQLARLIGGLALWGYGVAVLRVQKR
jgi:5-methylcytosine-specific restriction endonuclease McrA